MRDRRLVLVRHAQAGDAASDRDRALTEHGQRQADAVGDELARIGIAPDRVLVSPALRTRQTWERVVAALGSVPEPEFDERVYDNTVDGLFEVIRESDEDDGTLVVVGHNPAVGQLTHDLDDGEGDPAAREQVGQGFPPGAVAVFDVDTPFALLGPGGGTLVDVLIPAD
jgi:phosphohistidine phosphatase